jgi:hypothetical protein
MAATQRALTGRDLRQGQARGSFKYAGILFEETAAGSVRSTSPTRARCTSSRWACPGCSASTMPPAEFGKTANTIGLPRYAKQASPSKGTPTCFAALGDFRLS